MLPTVAQMPLVGIALGSEPLTENPELKSLVLITPERQQDEFISISRQQRQIGHRSAVDEVTELAGCCDSELSINGILEGDKP
jgi:hypothetical protein